MIKDTNVCISVVITRDQRDKLKAIANNHGWSVSKLVSYLITDLLRRD